MKEFKVRISSQDENTITSGVILEAVLKAVNPYGKPGYDVEVEALTAPGKKKGSCLDQETADMVTDLLHRRDQQCTIQALNIIKDIVTAAGGRLLPTNTRMHHLSGGKNLSVFKDIHVDSWNTLYISFTDAWDNNDTTNVNIENNVDWLINYIGNFVS